MVHNDTVFFFWVNYLLKSLARCAKLGLQFFLNQISSCTFETRAYEINFQQRDYESRKGSTKETELFSSINSAFIFDKL